MYIAYDVKSGIFSVKKREFLNFRRETTAFQQGIGRRIKMNRFNINGEYDS